VLKITITTEQKMMTFQLEGRLAGPWVRELELCWKGAKKSKAEYAFRVDLTAVIFISDEGTDLLRQLYREGVELMASGCLNKCIVEGIMRAEEKKAEG